MTTDPTPASPCDELAEYWLEHAEGALDADLARRVTEHLAACAACRAAYDADRGTAERLRALPAPAVAGLRARVDARIVAGEAARRWRLILPFSAAALVLLGVGVTRLFPTHPARAPFVGRVPVDDGSFHKTETGPEASAIDADLEFPDAEPPAVGAAVEITRGGKVVASGKIVKRLGGSRVSAQLYVATGEQVRVGDAIRLGQ